MNNKSTGEFIKELRKEKEMSQQKLAELTRIDRTTIAKYETGEREPNYYNLEILSDVLEVSVTELIAGGRKIKDYDKVDNAFKKMSIKNRKLKNLAKFLISIFGIIIMSLTIFIIVLNYTSTKVYKVYVNSNKIKIIDGLLVKTKDRIYLTFTNEISTENVDKINIYYKEGSKKEYIMKTNNIESVYFANKFNTKEYNRANFNKFLNNTYIELESKGKIIVEERLIFEFDYSNKNIDNGDENVFSKIVTENINRSEIYDLAKKFITNNNNKTYNIKLDGIKYEMTVLDNDLRINYSKSNTKYSLKYSIENNKEYISLQKNREAVYFYNISDGKCEASGCDKYKSNLKLIKSLIEKSKK